MLIKRKNLLAIKSIIAKKVEQVFDINTQYKFLLIEDYIDKEIEIARTQLNFVLEKYAQKDDNGDYKKNDGYVLIKDEFRKDFTIETEKLYDFEVTIPDIYFNLDELKDLKLSLGELKLMKSFLRDDL